MADSRWVVNASPLILLGKTGQIGLLSALASRIAVPRADRVVIDDQEARRCA
jgi:predicted nucleic acid-binding protein